MTKHRSFAPSDFGLRDIPRIVFGLLLISAISVLTGIIVQQLKEGFPLYVAGLLVGLGIGLAVALLVIRRATIRYIETIDIDSLPEVSENIQQICADSTASKLEAVKAYCNETGLGVAEAKAAVDDYVAKQEQQGEPEQD